MADTKNWKRWYGLDIEGRYAYKTEKGVIYYVDLDTMNKIENKED